MSSRFENFGKRAMAGEGGFAGSVLRGLTSAAEPLYKAGVGFRNWRFDHRTPVDVGKPTISIGNLTTGGTGKTPVVRWLCEKLLREEVRPAVLMRGYRSKETGGASDEQAMLDQFLGSRGVIIEADPDRVAGSKTAMEKGPDIGAFILDDGFQHRRVKRDLDIVLISANNPFGYDHVLPRGLLREPLAGLKRAGAVIITHARSLESDAMEAIKNQVKAHNPAVPIYHADHIATGFRPPDLPSTEQVNRFSEHVFDQPVLLFAGLGDPQSFEAAVKGMRARVVATHWFKDHHAYTPPDLHQLYNEAKATGAKGMITTEKDWVKVRELPLRAEPEIWRLDVQVRFWFDDERRLMDQVRAALGKPPRSEPQE